VHVWQLVGQFSIPSIEGVVCGTRYWVVWRPDIGWILIGDRRAVMGLASNVPELRRACIGMVVGIVDLSDWLAEC
jgi:hypothetical protein